MIISLFLMMCSEFYSCCCWFGEWASCRKCWREKG